MTTPEVPAVSVGAAPVDTVLHEERLQISLERRPTERIVIRKVIVEEQRTVTLTVRREELRITHVPAAVDARIPDREGTDPDDIVIVLHEEEPVVTLRTRPVEQVRIAVRRVTEMQTVAEVLGHEEATVEASAAPPVGGVPLAVVDDRVVPRAAEPGAAASPPAPS